MRDRRDGVGGVLVVGAGFIGRHVVRSLDDAGVPTTVLARSGVPVGAKPSLHGARVVVGDAGDRLVLDDALEGMTDVVWCAGGLLPADSDRQPDTDVMLSLPPLIRALDTLARRPGTGFVYLSSGGTVYGRPVVVPVPEHHPTEPLSSYGVARLAGESYVRLYAAVHGLRGHILRCGNVYGEYQPPDRGQGVVATFLQRALDGLPGVLFGDGRTVRDYVHVGDVVTVIRAVLDHRIPPQLLNVGTGVGVSVAEIAALVTEITGRTLQLDRRPRRGCDLETIVLDVRRLRHLMEFDPLPLRAGVTRAWAALLDDLALPTIRP